VGRSYPPEFYSFITNSRVRDVLERIATETEEDYQKLISLLKSFNVEIIRPELGTDFSKYFVRVKYKNPLAQIFLNILSEGNIKILWQ
jgi:hypothetical protein